MTTTVLRSGSISVLDYRCSAGPADEPFVELLIELTWSGGRLVREYTFLLDPPEYKAREAVAAAPKPAPPKPAVPAEEMKPAPPVEAKPIKPKRAPRKPAVAGSP